MIDIVKLKFYNEQLCVALPQFNRFVRFEGGRRNDVLGWMAGRTQHGIRVPIQTLYDFFALQIPNVDHVVFAARHDPLQRTSKAILTFIEWKLNGVWHSPCRR